jgi:hypothetical protein
MNGRASRLRPQRRFPLLMKTRGLMSGSWYQKDTVVCCGSGCFTRSWKMSDQRVMWRLCNVTGHRMLSTIHVASSGFVKYTAVAMNITAKVVLKGQLYCYIRMPIPCHPGSTSIADCCSWPARSVSAQSDWRIAEWRHRSAV